MTYEDSGPETSPFLRESLRDDVARRMHRRHIVTDLVQGRIDHTHPLLPWMQKAGFSDYDCHWFLNATRRRIDIIGLDYYEHTEVELYTTPEGYYRQRESPAAARPLPGRAGLLDEIPHPAHGHRNQRGRSRRRQDRVAGKERGRRAPVARGGFSRHRLHLVAGHRPSGLGRRAAAPDRAHPSRGHLPARTRPRRPARTPSHRPARRLQGARSRAATTPPARSWKRTPNASNGRRARRSCARPARWNSAGRSSRSDPRPNIIRCPAAPSTFSTKSPGGTACSSSRSRSWSEGEEHGARGSAFLPAAPQFL